MRIIFQIPLMIGGLILLFSPYLGLVFGVSLIVAAVGKWFFHVPMLSVYFSIAWKIYVSLAVFTIFVITTFTYQSCCVGLKTFRGHLLHFPKSEMLVLFISCLLWPPAWYGWNRNFSGWGLPWGQIILNAFEYWFVDSWKGIRLEILNFRAGEVRTKRVKNSVEAFSEIKQAIRE